MSQTKSTSQPKPSRREKHFAYRPGQDGVDETFDIYCIHTGEEVASFHFWEERERCRRSARQLTAALNALYDNGGHLNGAALLSAHDYLVRKYCGHQDVDSATQRPAFDCFDDYEIHGVRQANNGPFQQRMFVPDHEAQCWSLYGYRYDAEDELVWIGDYDTRAIAEELYGRMTGWYYRPHRMLLEESPDTSSILF